MEHTSRKRCSLINTTEYLLLELPEPMLASVFGGAFNARYDHYIILSFIYLIWKSHSNVNTKGLGQLHLAIMRLNLRNTKITMDGKHTMRESASQI
jgi:hypothetical protein